MEAAAAPASTAGAPPLAAKAWPNMSSIAPGSPIIETWSGFAAPCPDCGYMVRRKTPQEIAEALADRDSWHGIKACKEAAARLTDAEKARLQDLYLGQPQEGKGKPRKKPKAAKGAS